MRDAVPDIQIPEMDFARALADIVAGGLTRASICRILNVPRTTLDRWCDGTRPSWHHGTAILILHKSRAQTPGLRNTE